MTQEAPDHQVACRVFHPITQGAVRSSKSAEMIDVVSAEMSKSVGSSQPVLKATWASAIAGFEVIVPGVSPFGPDLKE